MLASVPCAALRLPRGRAQPLRVAARPTQPVVARGGDGRAAQPRREQINLFFPGHPAPLKVIHLNQTNLSEVLKAVGAIGFRTAHEVSWRLEDLPESGDVQVVLAEPADPFEEAQVDTNTALQVAAVSPTRIKELAALLRTVASTENPGATITALQGEPFKDIGGKDYVRFVVASVAGPTLYLGEMGSVIDKRIMASLAGQVVRTSDALRCGTSPELAAALQGVSQAKVFVGGEEVRPGLTVQEMVDLAADEDMTAVLPAGQGLGPAGPVAPAMPL